jgi:hypothetical protein
MEKSLNTNIKPKHCTVVVILSITKLTLSMVATVYVLTGYFADSTAFLTFCIVMHISTVLVSSNVLLPARPFCLWGVLPEPGSCCDTPTKQEMLNWPRSAALAGPYVVCTYVLLPRPDRIPRQQGQGSKRLETIM